MKVLTLREVSEAVLMRLKDAVSVRETVRVIRFRGRASVEEGERDGESECDIMR